MAKAYHFSDETPETRTTVHAFKELEDLKDFTRMHGNEKGIQKIWEIQGEVDYDDGLSNGFQIRVSEAKEVF